MILITYYISPLFLYIFVGNTCARSQRLEKAYSCSMTEVYLFFYNAALHMFMNFNKLLQREDPIIYEIHDQLYSFMKTLFGKFLTVAAIKNSLSGGITSVEYSRRENQLSG